jgi:septal ring factor EnvC (AmiA/AmiB activator)
MIGDSDEQSGTVGFLVGIIILVFAGIVFSLLADKRFKFASGKASLEESINDGKQQIAKLEARVEASEELWKKKVQPLERQPDELRAAADRARESGRRLADLRQRLKDLEAGLLAADDAFRGYRDQYRKQVRLAAVGEELPELRSRGGRTYSQVTVTRVTSAGVEFKHSQGISRLRPDDLDESWQERFQWHPEEQAKEIPAAATAPEVVVVPPAGKPAEDEMSPEDLAKEETEKKLAGLRRDVSESLRYLQKAEGELSRAQAGARNSRTRSVPGSLETWADRVKRMESLREKFRAQYVAARAKLATAAPDDPLLRMPER